MKAMKVDKDYVGKNAVFTKKITKTDKIFFAAGSLIYLLIVIAIANFGV